MSTEFNPEAIDGDGDGIIQEDTQFERPVEELAANLVEETAVIAEEAPAVDDATYVVVAEENNVISSETPKKASKSSPSIATTKDSTIGSTAAEKKDKSSKTVTTGDKVALFSEKNVSWASVGKLYRGYNFVSKSAADKWLDRSYVRLATPEEIARELGN